MNRFGLLIGSSAVTAAGLLAAVVFSRVVGDADPTPASARTHPATTQTAAAILADWDRARAHAWATGDVAALRRLYDAQAGRADLAHLRAWTERGLRVTGLRMQVLDLAVLEQTDVELVLRVTDRVQGAVAVGTHRRIPLPADQGSERVITLRHLDGRWLVSSVSG